MAIVTLTWDAPDSNSGGPVASYDVYRKSGSGGSSELDENNGDFNGWTNLTQNSVHTATSYADSSLSSGDGLHSYTVRAKNSGGSSNGCIPAEVTL